MIERILPTGIAAVLALLITGTTLAQEVPRPDLTAAQAQVRRKVDEAANVVAQNPQNASAWGRYGMVLHAHRCYETADRAYGTAMLLAPKEYQWSYLRAIVLQLRDPERALPLLDATVTMAPTYVPARIRRGMIREKLGDPDGAMADYEDALVLDPNDGAAHKHIGLIVLARGDSERAVRELEIALRDRPTDGAVLSGLARALRAVGRNEEARQRAEEARQTKPSSSLKDPILTMALREAVNLRSYLERSQKLQQAGKLDEAQKELEEALEFAPEDGVVLITLANIHLQKRDFAQVAEITQRAIATQTSVDECRKMLALALVRLGRNDEALVQAQLALEGRPTDPDVHQIRGEILASLGRRAEAIAALETAVEGKDDPSAYHLLGRLNLDSGQLAAAQTHFEKAVALRPEAPASWLLLGMTYLRQEETDQARAAIARARQLGPKDPFIIRQSAAALGTLGAYAEAKQCLADGLARVQNAPLIANDLAWLLATCPDERIRDGRRAVELSEQAVTIVGRAPAILDTLAAAYAEAGRFEDASEAMTEAVTKATNAKYPPDRIARYRQRLAEYRAGRPHRGG